MATVKACDICQHEGHFILAKYRAGFKKSKLKVDLCEKHKEAYPKKKLDFADWFYNEIQNYEISREALEKVIDTL